MEGSEVISVGGGGGLLVGAIGDTKIEKIEEITDPWGAPKWTLQERERKWL